MKQRVLTVFLTLFLVLSVTACSDRPSNKGAGQSDARMKTDSIAQNDVLLEQPVQDEPTSEPVQDEPTSEPVQKEPTSEPVQKEKVVPKQTSDQISREKAMQIAVKHAGFTVDQVSRLHAELDYERGNYQYDVEFDEGSYEYDYNIDAQTGKVLFFDKDADWD